MQNIRLISDSNEVVEKFMKTYPRSYWIKFWLKHLRRSLQDHGFDLEQIKINDFKR